MIAATPTVARTRPAARDPSRDVSRPRSSISGAATWSGASVFAVCLAAFVAVAVARIHEVIPGVAYLRPGKLLMLPMLVTAVVALPRWQVLTALRTRIALCVALIATFALFSIPLSVWPSNSIRFFVNVSLPALLLFAVASAGFTHRPTARLCILTLVLVVAVDALHVLVGPAPVLAGRPYIGVGLDPNESAALFVFTLPFAVALSASGGATRWLGLAIAGLLVAGVVATGSRGGVVGLVAVALTLIIRAGARRRVYVFAIGLCAAVFMLTADEARRERFATLLSPGSDYNVTDREGRTHVWARGLGYMLTHPVFGIGLNGFETAEGVLGGKVNEGYGIRYTAAHNAFVQIGAELGVVGLAAFIVALWSAGSGCRQVQLRAMRDRGTDTELAEQESRLAAAAFCGLIALVATSLFLSIAYHPITLFALAVCAGVWAGSPYGALHPPPPLARAPDRAIRLRDPIRTGHGPLGPRRDSTR